MASISSSFEDGAIRAQSTSSSDPVEIWSGEYDFALVATSWDRRCTVVTGCPNISFGTVAFLIPATTDSQGLRKKHDSHLDAFLPKRSSAIEKIKSDTVDIGTTWRQVRNIFWKSLVSLKSRRAASVFIDISTCPRYLTLAILRESLVCGLVERIDLGYSEAIYPAPPKSFLGMEEISFKDGAFSAVPVPGFLGEFDPHKSKSFLVSVGFDGWKTLHLISRKEPDQVALLLASPGVAPDYEKRTLGANSALIERYAIDDNRIVRARAGDAVDAWRKLTESQLENPDTQNVYYLCSGNKPHSVALALRACALETPTILYNRPTKHIPVDIELAGLYWRYSISPSIGAVSARSLSTLPG